MYESLSFGQWLKQRRKDLDLTQEELAERMGCSDIAIRKIEAGVRRPSRQVAQLLADLFNVAPEEREAFIGFARVVTVGDEPQQFVQGGTLQTASRPLLSSLTGNLPAQITRLIGREEVLDRIDSLLLQDQVRLLTLTGAPGIGKTRLALQVGSNLTPHFDDGIFLVLLSPISDPNLVAPAVAQALGVRETGRMSITVSLAQFLRDKHALLVLDNFEQVVEAAPAVVNILESCPHVKVVATSREPLHVRGEHVFIVPPLEVPGAGYLVSTRAHLQPELGTWYAVLGTVPAVALFVERAQAQEPDFDLTEQNGEAVAAICVRLEGLPLAIELAAARVRTFTPQEIKVRLDSRLKLLSGGLRDLPARQQTLRGAIDWSYALLSVDEQKLFARLAVFVGGFALPTAEAVCNARGDLAVEVLDAIDSLLDKSLLKREDVLSESRYTMLEMIREYAVEQLEQSGEAESIRRFHAEYYLVLAEDAEMGLNGSEQSRFLARLETEHDNIRAALRWTTEESGCEVVEIGLRTAGAIWQFWRMRGYFSEGRETLQRLVSRAALLSCSKGARAKALNGAGDLAYRQGDYSSARFLAGEALALGREVANNNSIALALNILGHLASNLKDYPTARALYEESLALRREMGEGIGGKWGIANLLSNLGVLAQEAEDYTSARALYEEGLALRKEIGDKWGIAYSLGNLGNLAYNQQEYAMARSLYRQSLTTFRELGDRRNIAWCLGGLGGVAASSGRPEQGARLLGAAEPLLEAMGIVLEPMDRIPYDGGIAAAHSQLGEAAFEQSRQVGRTMSMEEAIAYALEE